MKIFAIVVYKSPKDSFSAALGSNILTTDPFETLIINTLQESGGIYAHYLRENPGIHSLTMTDAASYAKCVGQKIMVVALDEAISRYDQHKLMEKIEAATSSKDLKALISQPEEAVKNAFDKKVEAIKSDIEESKQQMLINIEKIIERGEKIEILQEKTEALERQAFLFKKSAIKLKEQMRCPGMWSIFTPIANLASYVFRDNEVKYEYESDEPERKSRQYTF